MAGSPGPEGQAHEPRPKRPRDESVSPKPPNKRFSTDRIAPPRQRSRSRSRDRRENQSSRARQEVNRGRRSPSPRRPRHDTRDPPQARDPPQGRDPPQNNRQDPRDPPQGNRPSGDGPPRRRRPGPSAAISKAQREAHIQQAAQREAERKKREDEWAAQQGRGGVHEAVREHYNLVPQRGREWRRTESKIKGLREYNNWVKSVMIQRFSPSSEPGPGQMSGNDPLLVLDMGCGKGGDLFKWQKAPQRVGLYVGVDAAEVSIQQAIERYREARKKSRGRIFDARFFAMDAYGKWLGDEQFIREVGIDGGVGPGGGGNARWGGGGFDIVTMMFCLHYSFESEEKARGMLKNAAGALKKGGRMIGVMPSSDIIRSGLETFYKSWDKKRAAQKQAEAAKPEINGENNGQTAKDKAEDAKSGNPGASDDGFVPDSPTFMPDSPTFMPDSPTFAPESPNGNAQDSQPNDATDEIGKGAVESQDVAENPEPEWGNSLYRVRFPPGTPRDGIFRPMFGWKYQFKLEEAVEEVPEYIVPFEGFRALAEEYGLELTYSKPFMEIFDENRDDPELGELSRRMGVVDRAGGAMRMTPEEREAAAFYLGFCFVKV